MRTATEEKKKRRLQALECNYKRLDEHSLYSFSTCVYEMQLIPRPTIEDGVFFCGWFGHFPFAIANSFNYICPMRTYNLFRNIIFRWWFCINTDNETGYTFFCVCVCVLSIFAWLWIDVVFGNTIQNGQTLKLTQNRKKSEWSEQNEHRQIIII